MAHISSIGAAMFSDLSIAMPATAPTFSTLDTAAEFQALFATAIPSVGGTPAANTFVRVGNARSFPAIGTPANVVKVPVYGQKISSSIQGQADAPQLEVDINFVATEWDKVNTCLLGSAVGNGVQYVMRFTLLNTEPTGTGATKYASTAAGVGSVENSQYYWIGKIESLLVTPSLTDATVAKLAMSLQSDFFGPYTV